MNAGLLTTRSLLDALGINRVIWIDDRFELSLSSLRAKLVRNPHLMEGVGLQWLGAAINAYRDGDEDLLDQSLVEALEEACDEDLADLNKGIRRIVARKQGQESGIESLKDDLPTGAIEAACQLLGVIKEDRKGFEEGRRLVNEDDKVSASTAYVVDLQDAFFEGGNGADAGIEIIKTIQGRGSYRMVFVLTHETSVDAEAVKEDDIASKLGEDASKHPYPCAISKDRIADGREDALSAGLAVALKRSALRCEIFRVAEAAERHVADAAKRTRQEMGRIPPEELDRFFVQRAVKEGSSDLHMIERIVSAQVSLGLRQMFVSDVAVKSALTQIRMLRAIELPLPTVKRHKVIERFRQDEIWEEGEFLRISHSPLALGDVFETSDGRRSFVLLGQPCDLMLRGDGSRSAHTAELVLFSPKLARGAAPEEVSRVDMVALKVPAPASSHTNEPGLGGGLKTLDLPIGDGGKPLRFDFRRSAAARLDLLDLATFDPDGEVKICSSQVVAPAMLRGQGIKFTEALKLINALDQTSKLGAGVLDKRLLRYALTLKSESPFNMICTPTGTKKGSVTTLHWDLRRTRRLRGPYVDMLLDRQMEILNRRALDVDYLPEADAQSDADETSPG